MHEITHGVLNTSDNDHSLPNVGLKTSWTYQRFAENDPWLSISCMPNEPHLWCLSGEPMVVPGSDCQGSYHTTAVVTYVCEQSQNPSLSKCCDPSSAGKWDWDCVQAGAAWASQQTDIGDVCGRDAWGQGPITAPGPTHNPQYYPRDFSVFVLNDATEFPDVHGYVGAGGQFKASNFNLAFLAPIRIALVAGGQVTVQNGTINGSVFSQNLDIFDYTPQYTLSDSVTVSSGASVRSTTTWPINFDDAFVKLRNMSQALKGYPSSPSANISTPNGVVLNIGSSEKEVNVVTLFCFTAQWHQSHQPELSHRLHIDCQCHRRH